MGKHCNIPIVNKFRCKSKKYKQSVLDNIKQLPNKKKQNTKYKATTLYDYIIEMPIVRKSFVNNT